MTTTTSKVPGGKKQRGAQAGCRGSIVSQTPYCRAHRKGRPMGAPCFMLEVTRSRRLCELLHCPVQRGLNPLYHHPQSLCMLGLRTVRTVKQVDPQEKLKTYCLLRMSQGQLTSRETGISVLLLSKPCSPSHTALCGVWLVCMDILTLQTKQEQRYNLRWDLH